MKRLRRILFNTLTAISRLLVIPAGISVATGWQITLGTWPDAPVEYPRPLVRFSKQNGVALMWFTSRANLSRLELSFAGFEYLESEAAARDFTIVASLRCVRIPHWAVWGIAAALLGTKIACGLMSRVRDLPTACPACGYDMRANPAKCSECGHEPAEANA